MMHELWDFSWMAAAVQSLETYAAALETAEFPSLLLAALDELLHAPEANATPLQELADVLLQMIEFPIDVELPKDTVNLLHSTRDWAIQTLLDVQAVQTEALQPSKTLQEMHVKLFVAAPYRDTDLQVELHQSLLAAVQAEEDGHSLADVLDMCATSLQDDAQFLQFAEAALTGKVEALAFGSSFLQRLFDRSPIHVHASEQGVERKTRRRLFDHLTLESQVRVWANHLPSWRSQLQTWMLEAHRAPFQPIRAVLPGGWWVEDASGTVDSDNPAVAAACRRHSHLYVTLVEWCRSHVDLLSSSRSMELVSVLSESSRQENAARLFNRQLLSQVPLGNRSPGVDLKERALATLSGNLERLQAARSASDIVWRDEWIGVLEWPHLLHDALDIAFRSGTRSDSVEPGTHGAAPFFGWFYSFSSPGSAVEIAELLTLVASELKVPDIQGGAQWLRRSRADFGILPALRLRLVWFWLLKSIDELQDVESVRATAATTTTDVLESVEYIFRRFTPLRAKRPFQVELVTQLLAELEWRAANVHVKRKDGFLDGIEPLCAWLTKIVRLMQLEEQTAQQKDRRGRYGNRRSPANDVQHLAERLELFSR